MSSLADLARLANLKGDDICAVHSGGCFSGTPTLEIDPYDFLRRAEEDWELGGDSSALNAITNAKRAIICQMDQALMSFGYPATKWNIPKKIEAMTGLGLVAPRILRRVASARNLLEHEYRRPTNTEIEDALDLAALFVAAVKPELKPFPDEFFVGNQQEQIDSFSFQRDLVFSMAGSKYEPPEYCVWARINTIHTFQISGEACSNISTQRIGELRLNWKDAEFSVVVRLALAASRNFKLQKALDDFREVAGLR